MGSVRGALGNCDMLVSQGRMARCPLPAIDMVCESRTGAGGAYCPAVMAGGAGYWAGISCGAHVAASQSLGMPPPLKCRSAKHSSSRSLGILAQSIPSSREPADTWLLAAIVAWLVKGLVIDGNGIIQELSRGCDGMVSNKANSRLTHKTISRMMEIREQCKTRKEGRIGSAVALLYI